MMSTWKQGGFSGSEDPAFETVPRIRYQKLINSNTHETAETLNPESEYSELAYHKERSVFVVNSTNLMAFPKELASNVVPS